MTDRLKGTSAAAALVAGVAALVIEANPSLSATEVCEILTRTASHDLMIKPRTHAMDGPFAPVAPFDRGDFSADGWSPWFGHGKV